MEFGQLDLLEGVEDLVCNALSAAPDLSIIVVDRDLRYVAIFGAASDRHGLGAAVLEGQRAPDVLPPEVWENFGPLYARALDGEHVAHLVTTSDGMTDYATTFTPVRAANGTVGGFVLVARDVTGGRHTRQLLADSKRLHAMVAENTGDVFSWLDLEGRYTYLSGSAKKVYGWNVDARLGLTALDFIHPDDRPRVSARHVAIRLGDLHAVAQYRVRREDDTWNWVESSFRPALDDDGTLVGIQATEHDLTERRHREFELAQARELFEMAFSSAPIGMALMSPDGRLLRVNSALCEFLGYTESQLLTTIFQDFSHPEDLDRCINLLDSLIEDEINEFRIEKRYFHADGQVLWALVAVTLVRDPDGSPRWFICQVADITARKVVEAELQYQAHHDQLTGLRNRAGLIVELDECLERCRRDQVAASILLVDLDGFKLVNDRFGHEFGDRQLQAVAQAMASAIRDCDSAGRLGGDEFVVILRDTSLDKAQLVAERIVTMVAGIGGESHLHASVGIALATATDDAVGWLRAADRAMYDAKRAGGDQVSVAPMA